LTKNLKLSKGIETSPKTSIISISYPQALSKAGLDRSDCRCGDMITQSLQASERPKTSLHDIEMPPIKVSQSNGFMSYISVSTTTEQ